MRVCGGNTKLGEVHWTNHGLTVFGTQYCCISGMRGGLIRPRSELNDDWSMLVHMRMILFGLRRP